METIQYSRDRLPKVDDIVCVRQGLDPIGWCVVSGFASTRYIIHQIHGEDADVCEFHELFPACRTHPLDYEKMTILSENLQDARDHFETNELFALVYYANFGEKPDETFFSSDLDMQWLEASDMYGIDLYHTLHWQTIYKIRFELFKHRQAISLEQESMSIGELIMTFQNQHILSNHVVSLMRTWIELPE